MHHLLYTSSSVSAYLCTLAYLYVLPDVLTYVLIPNPNRIRHDSNELVPRAIK